MKVYLRVEDGLELLGHSSLEDRPGESRIDLAGSDQSLTYDLRSVPCLTEDGQPGEERAILLSQGQSPDVLPGWEPLDDEDPGEVT